MAIAAGIGDGLGLGDNTRAVLITRGLAELGRLGVALGGKVLTFGGLAGVGDLVATCASPRAGTGSVGFAWVRAAPSMRSCSGMQMVAEASRAPAPSSPGAGPRGRDAHRRAGPSHRGGSLLTGRGPHEPHAPSVPTRVGRGLASGSARMSGLFHGYDGAVRGRPRGQREAATRAHVKEILLMHGATEEEIDRAVDDGVIDLFVADRMLVPSPPVLARRGVGADGCEPGQARALLACARVSRGGRRRAGVHRSRPRGRPDLPGPAGPGRGRRRDSRPDGPRHRIVDGAHRRGRARPGRPWHRRRSIRSCRPRPSPASPT